MRTSRKGLVTKIRVLKQEPTMLIRFSLVADDETVNCIVANELVVHKILMMPESSVFVNVFGHFNKRKQFVVNELGYQTAVKNVEYFRKRA